MEGTKMATATRIPQQPQEDTRDVLLTLSADEALTLMVVLRAVGGDAAKSRRGQATGIAKALENARVPVKRGYELGLSGDLYFESK
jgi:hypothetical protein